MLGSLSPTSLLVVGGLVLTRSSLVHLGLDAVLLSAFLAGIRRTTGLSYAHISPYVYGHLFRLQASPLPSPQQGHSPWVRLSLLPLLRVDALSELLHSYLELGRFYLSVRCQTHLSASGEYVFDFAVVAFGVRFSSAHPYTCSVPASAPRPLREEDSLVLLNLSITLKS